MRHPQRTIGSIESLRGYSATSSQLTVQVAALMTVAGSFLVPIVSDSGFQEKKVMN